MSKLRIFTVIAIASVSVSCQSKKALDLTASALHQALLDNNYAAFKVLALPALVDKVSKQRFKLFSLALKALGPIKDKSMTGINVKAGGVRSGTYKLTMTKGKADLKLTVVNGKLNAFNFDGADIVQASTTARKALMLHAGEGFFKAVLQASYDAFKAIAHPALIKEVSAEKFVKMAKMIKSFGDLKEKKQLSAEIKDGKAVGRYRLEFATRTLILEVSAVYGELVRYGFKPEGQAAKSAPPKNTKTP
jgi:hypothetical protein